MALIEVESKIILADPEPNVNEFNRSLTSMFGQFILWAEELFGKRDMDYTLLGIEFVEMGQHIYHLGPEINKQIIIHLPKIWLNDYTQCLYMVAHESFHCISPIRRVQATNLEEGLATYFAKECMARLNLGNDWRTGSPNYDRAMADAEAILALDNEIIKKTRLTQPTISLISKDNLITSLNINTVDQSTNELLDRLTSQFNYV